MRSAALFVFLFLFFGCSTKPSGKIIAFYTAKNDPAHISFVNEANQWLAKQSEVMGIVYDFTDNWNNLNDEFLKDCKLLIFLDTRPDSANQRNAFRNYMEKGGAWIGFHFAGFALDNSAYPQDWNWYHNEFLGSGQYKGNTWRPTSAVLKVERSHPVTTGLSPLFTASPNEWYSWENDLRQKQDIDILVSIDSSSFPLGTGPKLHEIWHQGYYPVVWTNKNYRMLYVNMGHNDIDYENNTGRELSFTFGNAEQDRMITNAIEWLLSD